MFNFIKKLLGYPTEAEKAAAKAQAEAPYKIEAPVAEAPKVFVDGHGDVREVVPTPAPAPEVKAETAPAVNDQITDAVTQTKPAAMTAKKKPANKKPAGEKKAASKKPGRKPKSAKV